MTHNEQHYPNGWTCPQCHEVYRRGAVVHRACCLRESGRAVPVLEYATRIDQVFAKAAVDHEARLRRMDWK